MIPLDYITAWKAHAPWQLDSQVEQDLVLSRSLVEIFSDPLLSRELAFRGGTALHKLVFQPPGRYSEDIDLVQVNAGHAGPLMTALHNRLNPWLDKPTTKQGHGRVTFIYRFRSESPPVVPMRLKVEINTREHFTVHSLERKRLTVTNPWFAGDADIPIYKAEELLGTKLRALYQRKKGRDVFDLALALQTLPGLSAQGVVTAFQKYIAHGDKMVSRAELEANLAAKRGDPDFFADVSPLLRADLQGFDLDRGLDQILDALVALLPGEPWKGDLMRERPRGR